MRRDVLAGFPTVNIGHHGVNKLSQPSLTFVCNQSCHLVNNSDHTKDEHDSKTRDPSAEIAHPGIFLALLLRLFRVRILPDSLESILVGGRHTCSNSQINGTLKRHKIYLGVIVGRFDINGAAERGI